ncbi:glycosyl transferase [Pectobacterium carotovorum subsp. carotovorum]|uniref:glycosyltransferase n=1 Tax=Pectobacterium brasiliense TaxID=180957 RepID=UPI0020842DAB|nr:glycosyltransferase [Pectobacterium brasiliense]MDY4335045.1 glycosyltransferase [Pectobacterium brasiliense]GKV76995.1 glycosyl transferase [Pectobacterium carotovorum subsp. carotovorum]
MFSVLMSVYVNDIPKFLEIALKSIYDDQTKKPDQIVIVADGKLTPELDSIICEFKDRVDKILDYIEIPSNIGLAKALNIGMSYCKYNLIARMDSDDISLPDRFKKQYDYMKENPHIGVCGTYIREVDPKTCQPLSIRSVPTEHDAIEKFAIYRSPISHPSVMYRKETILSVGGYPPFRKSQDYALWSLLLKNKKKFHNIPELLLDMRTGSELYTRRGIKHLKSELAVIGYQKSIGFISYRQYVFSLLLRLGFRLSPVALRRVLYSVTRK